MPTFATTEPVSLKLELLAADIRLLAGSHADGTTVEVSPADDSAAALKAAESTTVEFSKDRLEIRTPKQRAPLFGRGSRLSPKFTGDGVITVTVRLAAGSTVKGVAGLATLTSEGRLGEVRFHSGTGDITLARTGPLKVETALGAVTVQHADSDVEVKTANGDIKIGEVGTGSVQLSTSLGSLEVGVRAGTSALLDVSALLGSVVNDLDATDGPDGGDRVKISARTLRGDVWVHRA
jgi:hypothetical protein